MSTPPRPEPIPLSPHAIVARIFAIVLSTEFVIMLLLSALSQDANVLAVALLDVVLLALLATPVIYLWVIKPFVDSRELALAEVSELALTDALTELANRRSLDRALATEHSRHTRSGAPLSLLMVDIDFFKVFNDTYGHPEGDRCLQRVARVVAAGATRPADLAVRYGGEEFVCLLPETGREGALEIAERIRRGVEALDIPNRASPGDDRVTVSVGVATRRCSPENSPASLLAAADQCLYRAKTHGRNRVEADPLTAAAPPAEAATEPGLFKLVWKDAYACGHPLLDAEHQALFLAVEQLLEYIASAPPAAEVAARMNLLLDEVALHFRDEIRILDGLGYEALKPHAEEHSTLVKRGYELARALEVGRLPAGEVFQFFANEVILQHMLGSDRAYYPLLAGGKAA